MAAVLRLPPEDELEHDIVRLLSHHYGDGGIYMPRGAGGSDTLRAAVAGGFVSHDGFITRKGRQLLARLIP
ncbi:MAG: hypothetical protein ACPHTD_12745 [Gammaproteobacteria bacterium]|jgi:hypothetical protein